MTRQRYGSSLVSKLIPLITRCERAENSLSCPDELGIANQGLATGDGRIGGPFTIEASGELRAEAGRSLTQTGAGNTNAGRNYLQGGTVEFHQNLTNTATGQILGRGTLMLGGTGLINQGHIALSGGITDVFGDVSNNTGAATRGVSVSGNTDVTFWDDVTNVAGSLFRVSSGSSGTFFGAFAGSGFSGTGNVYFEADVTPGASPALVEFGGNVSLGSNATLQIELSGTVAGSQYDQIGVTGELTLGGTFEISLINGFTPSAGQTFDILNWGSLAGAFSVVQLPLLQGLAWNASQLAAGMLSVAIPGDFNLDGSADYVIWRKTDGTQTGYNDGRANFGRTAGGGSGATGSAIANATVPEPTTQTILVTAMILMFACQRARCHKLIDQ